MKLKKLEMTGFKSFVDRSFIKFPPGVSAVVGPNGCGKSNILDALRWVMGEQSAKTLRGKAMDDVIFAGANGKPPVNMAEVSLTLVNDSGSGPPELKEFSEIMLTRRLYREGGSSYFINRQPCRLKDMQNIFLSGGLSARSYAIIQQGSIGEITEAGPDKRRLFIEEIAGVSLYKQRRKEALAKVESTRQNLLRINDIVAEIQRQMNSLNRQARKARRYKIQRERLKTLDILIALGEHGALCDDISKTGSLLNGLNDSEIGYDAELGKLDAEVEEIKRLRSEKSQGISELKSETFEKQRAIDKIENDLSHFRGDLERISRQIAQFEGTLAELGENDDDISSDIARLQDEKRQASETQKRAASELDAALRDVRSARDRISSFKRDVERQKSELMDRVALEARHSNICQNAGKNKEAMARRIGQTSLEKKETETNIARIEKKAAAANEIAAAQALEMAGLTQEADALSAFLESKNRDLANRVKATQKLELDKQRNHSKYAALKKVTENFDWCRDGVKAIMKACGPTSSSEKKGGKDAHPPIEILGLTADVIEPDPLFDAACEAALGDSLQYVIVKNQASGVLAMDYLQSNRAGRSGFIPLSSVFADTAPMDKNPHDPVNDTRLLDHVSIKPGFEKIAHALLGHVLVAKDMNHAIHLHKRHGACRAAVTQNGDFISRSGVMIGGGGEKLSGILAKKKELKQISAETEKINQSLAASFQSQKEAESEVVTAERTLQKMIAKKIDLEQTRLTAEKQAMDISSESRHEKRHYQIVCLEHERLMGEESDLKNEMVAHLEAAEEISAQVKTARESVAKSSEKATLMESEISEHEQIIMDLKLEQTALNATIENNEKTLARLVGFKNEQRKRLMQLELDIERQTEKKSALDQRYAADERTLALKYEEIKRLARTLEEHEVEFHGIQETQKEHDGLISGIQKKRDAQLEKIKILELEQSRRQIAADAIQTRMTDAYDQTLSELRRDHVDGASADPADDAPPPPTDANDPAANGSMPMDRMKSEFAELKKKMPDMEDIHLGAIKEHEIHKARHEFLTGHRDDLLAALENLQTVIDRINQTTKTRFMEAFNAVNDKLRDVFPRLFQGGSAALSLTDPNDPIETGVEFMVHPPGKKLTRMSLLSGGEKALAGIAFVFSVFLIKPASFCLMDEIDAPLDDANTNRFNELLKVIGEKSQIVMITHSKRSMEFAESLFGVTMENKGVSKILSITL